MKSMHNNPTKRRYGSRGHVALRTGRRQFTEVEDLYWFAMALTGDADFAAKLVANSGKLTSTARGIFRD